MGGLHLRLQMRPAVAALAAYLLCCCVVQAFPACSQLSLRIRSSSLSVRPGGSLLLKARLVNKGDHTLSSIGVRLDLLGGLVSQQGQQRQQQPIIVNGGTTAYWKDLQLNPGKRRMLKVKAHACGTAKPGSFPLGGAVYLVNATGDVTCLSPATAKPSTVRGAGMMETNDLRFDDVI